MTLSELQQKYASLPVVRSVMDLLKDSSVRFIFCKGLRASSASLFSSALVYNRICPLIFILDDLEEAGYFYHDLVQILGDESVLFFPSSYRRAVKYGQKDSANEILRTEVLSRLQQQPEGLCIVTYPEALAEKVVSLGEMNSKMLQLHVGDKIQMTEIGNTLREYGFEYVDYVYEPGQYALRGSIIDVYSFSSEYPCRIDFFGDEIDSIRTFEVQSQLSRDKLEEVAVVPDLSADSQLSGSFFDFIPQNSVVSTRDFTWVCQRIQSVHDESLCPQAIAVQEAEELGACSLEGKLIDGNDFRNQVQPFRHLIIAAHSDEHADAVVEFNTSVQPVFHKNFDLVASSFHDYLDKGYVIYICSDSRKQTDRIASIFADRGDDISFVPVDKTLHEGFVDHNLKVCVFTDHQLFDRFHKYNLKSDKVRNGKVSLSLKELNLFTPGDYVVHIDHGIGRFAGLVRIPSGDTTQEVMKLVYQNDDIVFVSIHALHKVSKYKGKDGEPPKLSKLGSGAWEKIKNRTKTKIKDIARDLIKLYSQRREEKGFAYSPDTFLQRELEASFLYEDTPDQSKATAEVKADMERDRPMDRLVCGDVGFGKTEVAVRAAFKAVSDNKQVAVLVPTTVLAYQHYNTFVNRLKDFPCKVEYLSRARTATQTRKVLKELKDGEVNILIGTHRILGKDVHFKDLGLLIIDEEQKFGVSVKEKLRQLKVNVDTLTLTATPIPRTLQFSLMGARDLSVIATPPPNRYPVQTEVHTFSEQVITDAINFEMSRNGQVFFINNRIANLASLKEMIVRNIPDCRVCIGHGQMEPAELEKVVLGFINYDYDVLLSTTIVENGVDISNANTIIVNEAQNFGLSDLHQMRGRVGRSNKKAFCYLIAPPLSSLTSEGKRRLQAIENFSDLGSGIHIAMRDLDIRGAGNMLGAEQSGFIADLGYETYQKILNEAVHELKNDEFAELYEEENRNKAGTSGGQFVEECVIDSDWELLLPADYVAGSSERMALYRELDGFTKESDVEQFRKRLVDRFGPVPPETEELLRIVPLKLVAVSLGIEKVLLKGHDMIIYLVSNSQSPYYMSDTFGHVLAYVQRYPRRCQFRANVKAKHSIRIGKVPDVKTALEVLREMAALPVSKN